MAETTNRQFNTYREWMRLEMNDPSRDTFYLMQIAAVLASQRGKARTVEQMKIDFKQKGDKPVRTDEQKRREVEVAKANWRARGWGKKKGEQPK